MFYVIRKDGENPTYPWTFEDVEGDDCGSSATWAEALHCVLNPPEGVR